MLPPGSIIGVTANSTEEAIRACENGADYLGIGTLFATPTQALFPFYFFHIYFHLP